MNYRDAKEILGLPDEWDEVMLRKAYRQKARRYHPDKNRSVDASLEFEMVKRAFEYLLEKGVTGDREKVCGVEMDLDFVSLFDKLPNVSQEKLRRLFGACKEVVGITKEVVGDILVSRKNGVYEYELEVDLQRILKDEVYMVKHKGRSLMAPLWFDNVYYEELDTMGDVVNISVIPQLPSGVSIDQNNHMTVRISEPCLREFDVKQFVSPNAEQVDVDIRGLKKGARITLWNVGLLKVMDDGKMNTREREGVTFVVE